MKYFILTAIFSILFTVNVISQTSTYTTSGGEMIFSFASIKDNGRTPDAIMRWSPVLNLQSMLNHDVSKHFGLILGLAVRNVGYIYDNYKISGIANAPDSYVKKKFRSYNVGLPVGFKIGNLNKAFIYAGYEVEVPFLYKEKTFDGGDKISKITGWFSNRQDLFQHGFFAGIQFPHGLNLKFKYYMSEFHNENFIDSQGSKPYSGLNSHVFYFSLSSFLFKNSKLIK